MTKADVFLIISSIYFASVAGRKACWMLWLISLCAFWYFGVFK